MMFQSSPAPKDGCNCGDRRYSQHPDAFQSSPAPKDGCNVQRGQLLPRQLVVSILTRPEGRVQQAGSVGDSEPSGVSILTRPEGRVQLGQRRIIARPHRQVSILTRPEGRVQQNPPSGSGRT